LESKENRVENMIYWIQIQVKSINHWIYRVKNSLRTRTYLKPIILTVYEPKKRRKGKGE